MPRQISGRRAACPPARRPRRELRSARRLEARPGPAGLAAASNRSGCLCAAWPASAAARGHRGRSLRRPLHRRRGFGVSVRVPPDLWPPQLTLTNFARNSPATVSNLEFISLELQRFWGVSKSDRDKLRAKCGWWCRRRPWVSRLGAAGEVARCFETAIAFARLCLCGCETAIAFAGTGRASNETGIAFAGENWVFLARFSLALVLSVSTGVVQGRALVMVVSRWPVSVVVEVSLVSPSPPQCVLCAKKFALRAQNTPKSAFLRLLGEFFRGNDAEGAVLGEFFRGPAVVGSHGASCVAPWLW